jgi:hypothetical protein
MSHLPFSERDIERLLEGNVPPGRGDLAHLARLFARVRAEVTDEPIPPMSARLLAELDASELTGRLQSELDRAAERRRVQQGRRRWRAVAAAAAIVVVGGVAFAALQGPLGDDLRTRPGDDEPVSVADSGDATTSTAGDGTGSSAEVTDTDGEGAPVFSADDDPPGDLDVGGGSSSGVATTEVPEPPDQEDEPSPDTNRLDMSEILDECGDDTDCWTDAADEACQEADVDCWAAFAAEACGHDPGCRYQLSDLCGATEECRDAIWDGQRRHSDGDGR